MKSLLVPLALLLGLPSAASAGALRQEEPDLALKKSPTTLLELSRSTKKVKVFPRRSGGGHLPRGSGSLRRANPTG